MGEWKSQVSFRIQPALRIELQEFANQERRSLGNLGAVLLEWGFEQLKVVGSVDRLLKGRIRGNTTRPRPTASGEVPVGDRHEKDNGSNCREGCPQLRRGMPSR